MKQLLLIEAAFFSFLIFDSCASPKINGQYTNVYFGISGEEFRFVESTKSFKYYRRTEGATIVFSEGTWEKKQKNIFLNGFTNNLKVLGVYSKIDSLFGLDKDEIVINFRHNPFDTFIKAYLNINGNVEVPILKDTSFVSTLTVKTIQIKSYLTQTGSIASPTVTDLSSSPIIVNRQDDKSKRISLVFAVNTEDFYRTPMTDTLKIKTRNLLIWGNRKFKKLPSRKSFS